VTSHIEAPSKPGGGGAPPPGGAPPANGNGGGGGAAAIEGGSYDVIRRRLLEQAAELAGKADALNERRKRVFGGTELSLIANERMRTEHNCVARDIVSVGGRLLVGFQVFLGLKTETNVGDVFSYYQFDRKPDDTWDLSQLPAPDFLAADGFVKELRDAFKYGKDARLLRMKRTDTRLFAAVQIGATVRDAKVFRWAIDAAGRVSFMDSRGDEEMVPPRQHDFEWTQTRREDHVAGPFPHINVLDTVFVETVGGDLTVKVENNTKDGKGIYREPVEDPNQTLDDADIAFAKVGLLILLRIKPFREQAYRYLVYDSRARKVTRIDGIGRACHELPEDHGIVFPGGYYLQSGDHKIFDGEVADMEFERVIKSPNGEDVLYVYHRRDTGDYLLLPYNVIKKEVTSAMHANGYSLFADGTLAVFRSATEPTRVHPLQIWRSPFSTAEFAASAPKDGSYLAKVGNADLVRGISDALSLRRLANVERPTRTTYEDLVSTVTRAIDAHYWLGHAEAGDLLGTLTQMKKTCELVLDEFDKVEAIERRAREAFDTAEAAQKELLKRVRPDDLRVTEDYLRALTTLRTQRGQLISLKDLRGMDVHAVARLENEVVARYDEVSLACVSFFLKDDAWKPLLDRLDAVVTAVEKTDKAKDLEPYREELDLVQQGLTLLAEVIGSLKIDDATARTRILEGVSAAFAQQNRARAVWQARKKDLGAKEGRAEFAAQFRLFGQAVTGALALCDTPEACDEQLSKLLLSLEELEGKFGDLDEFTADLAAKREEVVDAIGARRQQLLDERQKRIGNLMNAADRILSGVVRRAKTFTSVDELNAYFASDAMILKLGEVQQQIATLGDAVKAESIQSRLKAAKQESLRAQRDKADLGGSGENVIRLGRHEFSVHTQPLELVLVPRDDVMTLHLTGTEYFEPIEDQALAAARDLWEQTLPSETAAVYRGEFLASCIFFDAEEGKNGLSVESLAEASRDGGGKLLELVRAYGQDRLDEGYERGIHDADATRILEKLVALRGSAGLLRFSANARATACLWWSSQGEREKAMLSARARSVGRLRAETSHAAAQAELAREIEEPIAAHAKKFFREDKGEVATAARYLVLELAQPRVRFTASAIADSVCRGLLSFLDENGSRRAFEDELAALAGASAACLAVALAYVDAFVSTKKIDHARPYVREAAVMIVESAAAASAFTEGGGPPSTRTDRDPSAATVATDIDGLLGAHPRIQNRTMKLAIDELLSRMIPYVGEHAPRFRAFRQVKAKIVEREKARLRLSEFAPRVLTSFVRNRLIDQVYLPLIGANLAKQIGAVGDKKRTDLMGMLLLVSPPGYGKTTLMEYIASKLGLVFMKVNGPSLGHDVTSLDPAEAKSMTARQEVEKINLAFEMQSNVMLYLDDIQHVNTELLQKFISLCDAQRKVEGVWKGRSRTYDLRGKKFCVVMAGNPYTETGARFQIPDMLANRADTYNLGDILGGQEELFASSYLENSLTSNPALAPLATRDPGDIQKLVRLARGEDVPLTDLSHGYSAAEVEEVTQVLRHLMTLQKLLLRVNLEYIRSASQEDAFRTEPPFKLQGSYRNMNKLAEKVVAAMNADELERLVDDHYQSESQTLTTGAEQNLLKLAEVRGRTSDEQKKRWAEIKDAYVRNKRSGGKGDDPVARVTGALGGVDEQLQKIGNVITTAATALAKSKPASVPPPAQAKPPKVEVKVDSSQKNDAVVEIMREHTKAVEKLVAALAEAAKAPRRTLTPPMGAVAPPPTGSVPPPPPSMFGGATAEKLDEIVALVKRLEQRLASVQPSVPRFDVALDGSSASNFYRSMDGDDVVQFGGLFVATYAKLPHLGTTVVLGLDFPGGVRLELSAVVAWTQDDLGEASPAGFGARLVNVPNDARAVIAEYVRAREPLVRD
jgi:hypothetical protein